MGGIDDDCSQSTKHYSSADAPAGLHQIRGMHACEAILHVFGIQVDTTLKVLAFTVVERSGEQYCFQISFPNSVLNSACSTIHRASVNHCHFISTSRFGESCFRIMVRCRRPYIFAMAILSMLRTHSKYSAKPAAGTRHVSGGEPRFITRIIDLAIRIGPDTDTVGLR